MKSIFSHYIVAAAAVVLVGSSGCYRAGGEYPGTEYMPDMVHSIAYEANYSTYYRNNTWASPEEYRQLREPRTPADGTIPRGTSVYGDAETLTFKIGTEQISMKPLYNPYHYKDTEDERTRAQQEITVNPLQPQTDAQLQAILGRGKFLYNTYCGICHGEKGDGNGYLYRDGDGPYKLGPANYLKDDFIAASDGRFYHAIMYGKNAMLGHADKLNYEERWMVIHYIRNLQHKSKGTTYDLAAANGGKSIVAPSDSTAASGNTTTPDNSHSGTH